jgi:hypothetical protein
MEPPHIGAAKRLIKKNGGAGFSSCNRQERSAGTAKIVEFAACSQLPRSAECNTRCGETVHPVGEAGAPVQRWHCGDSGQIPLRKIVVSLDAAARRFLALHQSHVPLG